jgi:cytochrome c oxidase subunit II
VIHSWWVPALAIKKDTVPGFINESWAIIETPGTYRGQCAELCGVNHGFMPIVVEAKSEVDFNAWVAAQKLAKQQKALAAAQAWSKEDLLARGEAVYKTTCIACHQANGQGIPGIFPGLKGSKVALGDVKTHIAVVLRGVPGTAMQAFGSQLDDADLAAVITYERNAWGNNTGDLVQPTDVAAAR